MWNVLVSTLDTSRGLYGARVTGIGGCPSLAPVPSAWPEWRVVAEHGLDRAENRPESIGPDAAFIRFGDGSTAELSREDPGGRLRLSLAKEVASDDLAHPFLAPVGMLGAYWSDRLPLHAASFGIGGRAWLLVADKSGGKSTTMAMLDLAGYSVLADDLSVIEPDLTVHRGPRFIDLREDAARSLGVGDNVGEIGLRERWRYRIADGPLTLPLGGIVIPSWGEPGVELIVGSERLPTLGPSLALRIPAWWDELFMDIAFSVPVLRWTRPREVQGSRRSLDQLVDAVGALRAP
jgi:hypothetical protein